MKAVKIMSIALALVLCLGMLAGLVSCGEKNYAANNTKVKIGLTGPLTGGAAIYGVAVKNAATLAVAEINEASKKEGGLGLEFELVMLDDKHDATSVENLYANLYEQGMQISLGTVTTKPGLEFKNFSGEDNVFFLTPSATGDDITKDYDNGYQMCFSDSNQGTAAADIFNANYKGKSVGIFYKADDEYSKGIYDNFKKNLDSSFKDVKEATFTGDASTFDSQINILKDCEIVFMPIYYTPASQFMTQAKNVANKIEIYYGCDGFDGIDAIEGFDINEVSQQVSYVSHFNSNAQDGPAKEFIDKYNTSKLFDAKKEPLNQFGAAAYDCVWAIYEALKVAKANGESFDATTSANDYCEILKAVFNSDDFVYHGITGECKDGAKSNISWNADGTVDKMPITYDVKKKTN